MKKNLILAFVILASLTHSTTRSDSIPKTLLSRLDTTRTFNQRALLDFFDSILSVTPSL